MWVQLTRGDELLNAGHQNNLGTTKTGYKFKNFTPTLVTDRFLLNTYFWKWNLLQALVHTEITNVS